MKSLLTIVSLCLLLGCLNARVEPEAHSQITGIASITGPGAVEIQPTLGTFALYQGPYYARQEAQIGNMTAKFRTTDKLPVFIVRIQDDLATSMEIVKLEVEPKDSSRHIKLNLDGSMPDKDWIINTKRTQISSGIWQFIPTSPMLRGEYALWKPRGIKDPREGHTILPGRTRMEKFRQYAGGIFFSFGIDD